MLKVSEIAQVVGGEIVGDDTIEISLIRPVFKR